MTETELQAAAFRRLVGHLQERTDVQNIDLMELAGFCRNCLSKWYAEAAEEAGEPISKEAARELEALYEADEDIDTSLTPLSRPPQG